MTVWGFLCVVFVEWHWLIGEDFFFLSTSLIAWCCWGTFWHFFDDDVDILCFLTEIDLLNVCVASLNCLLNHFLVKTWQILNSPDIQFTHSLIIKKFLNFLYVQMLFAAILILAMLWYLLLPLLLFLLTPWWNISRLCTKALATTMLCVNWNCWTCELMSFDPCFVLEDRFLLR